MMWKSAPIYLVAAVVIAAPVPAALADDSDDELKPEEIQEMMIRAIGGDMYAGMIGPWQVVPAGGVMSALFMWRINTVSGVTEWCTVGRRDQNQQPFCVRLPDPPMVPREAPTQ